MDFRYIKSVFYLVGFGGLGYGLLNYCTEDEADLKALRNKLPGAEKDPKEISKAKTNFTSVLTASMNSDKPLYRASKKEIDAEIRK